nr:CDGSH iron-sulfur domain-containing protein [uncultured Sphingomonas sp.]
MAGTVKIKVTKNGPYVVSGSVPLVKEDIVPDQQGQSVEWKTVEKFPDQANYALCRCGHSKTKPFCDGTHVKIGFDGTETASREPYLDQAKLYRGPVDSLTDAESLCAFARFCDPNGQVWNQVEETDEPQVKATFERQVNNCPSGRLVAWQNETGQPIEEKRDQIIALIEDIPEGCSGPLWVQGGIQVESADGFAYEVRNRQTLCRCGQSNNKPFCDGTHASIGFSDKS